MVIFRAKGTDAEELENGSEARHNAHAWLFDVHQHRSITASHTTHLDKLYCMGKLDGKIKMIVLYVLFLYFSLIRAS